MAPRLRSDSPALLCLAAHAWLGHVYEALVLGALGTGPSRGVAATMARVVANARRGAGAVGGYGA